MSIQSNCLQNAFPYLPAHGPDRGLTSAPPWAGGACSSADMPLTGAAEAETAAAAAGGGTCAETRVGVDDCGGKTAVSMMSSARLRRRRNTHNGEAGAAGGGVTAVAFPNASHALDRHLLLGRAAMGEHATQCWLGMGEMVCEWWGKTWQ